MTWSMSLTKKVLSNYFNCQLTNIGKRRAKNKWASCPVCNEELSKDLLKFFQHLDVDHYAGFQYLNGHFLYYQNGRLLDLKKRNTIESFCVKLLVDQADQFLKGKRGESISVVDKCSRCRVSRSTFTKYTIDNKYEFLICRRCKNSLFKTGNYVKIIYNPTELGKR